MAKGVNKTEIAFKDQWNTQAKFFLKHTLSPAYSDWLEFVLTNSLPKLCQ
jgi:hypothetical protein